MAFFGVLFAVFLKYLSSDIVLIFNRMGPRDFVFHNSWDVLEALESGTFTAVTVYKLQYDRYLNPQGPLTSNFLKRMQAAARHNPPLLLSNIPSAMDLVLHSFKSYVFFTDEFDIRYITARWCNINVLLDPQQSPRWFIILFLDQLFLSSSFSSQDDVLHDAEQ